MKPFVALIIALMCFGISYTINASYNIPASVDGTKFFIENKGQWPDEVKFMAKSEGIRVWITTSGIVFDCYQLKQKEGVLSKANTFKNIKTRNQPPSDIEVKGHVAKMSYAKKKTFDQILLSSAYGQELKNSKLNYFKGNNSTNWAVKVNSYEEVILNNIYDNIDARYYFDGRNVRYDYIIKPGAELSDLKMKFDLGNDLEYGSYVNDEGELVMKTSLGEITHQKLFAYQYSDDKAKKQIKCSFVRDDNGLVSFKTENYDRTKSLIIDPVIYSTFIGSVDDDYACNHIRDIYGNLILAGYCYSENYPTTPGAYDRIYNGGDYDIYVTKMNSSLTEILFSTYIGGNGWEAAWGLALDSEGDIYISSLTSSTDFPTTPGAFDNDYNGYWDDVIMKLNSEGSDLIYSTYVGGSNMEYPMERVTIDDDGNFYFVGFTYSTDFPVTPGCFNETLEADFDAYVAKLNPDGSDLVFCTYINGNVGDQASAIILDDLNQPIICGVTNSSNFYFTNDFIPELNPNDPYGDIFLMKFNYDCSDVLFSNRIGGSGFDAAWDLIRDSQGNIIVGGYTDSDNFHTTTGAYNENFNGYDGYYGLGDAIIFKVNPDGSDLLFSTYYGGSRDDAEYTFTIDEYDNVIAAVETISEDVPVMPGAYSSSYLGGLTDINIISLSSDGSKLLYSTYFGGSGWDIVFKISLDNDKNLILTGTTSSTDFPVTQNAYDQTHNGGPDYNWDNYITKFDLLSVITNQPNDIGSYSAKCSGLVPSGYNIRTKGICWSTDPNPTTSDFFTSEGSGGGPFESALSALIPDTKYYVRAYTTNDNGTVYGEEVEFTTLKDITPPNAICKDYTLYLPQSGYGMVQGSDIDNGSSDLGGIFSISIVPNSFTCSNSGLNDVLMTVVDNYANSSTCSAIITVIPPDLELNISVIPSPAVTNGQANTIYLGYGPSSLTLSATSGYSYVWMDGSIQISTNNSVTVSPTTSTTYSVTATNSNGCSETAKVIIYVIDVRAGNNNNQVYVCHRGSNMRIASNSVQAHLNHGDYLGRCSAKQGEENETAYTEYYLSQNSPNPFTNSTEFEYGLSEICNVKLSIYDIYSREIAVLVDKLQSPGQYHIDFDGSYLPSGVYTYIIDVNGMSIYRKMIVVK